MAIASVEVQSAVLVFGHHVDVSVTVKVSRRENQLHHSPPHANFDPKAPRASLNPGVEKKVSVGLSRQKIVESVAIEVSRPDNFVPGIPPPAALAPVGAGERAIIESLIQNECA